MAVYTPPPATPFLDQLKAELRYQEKVCEHLRALVEHYTPSGLAGLLQTSLGHVGSCTSDGTGLTDLDKTSYGSSMTAAGTISNGDSCCGITTAKAS